jgi:hypothetical protein
MPDMGTGTGLLQMIGMGLALLAFVALRSRRYGTDLFKSFIWLWTALCIGMGVYVAVDLSMPPADAAVRATLVFAVVAAAAWVGSRIMRPRAR